MYYETNYLAHYGVPGMKWGVYRSSRFNRTPNSSRSYAKRLNKLDQAYADNAAKHISNDQKARKIANKASDYISKHDSNPSSYDAKKLSKMTEKGKKYLDRSKAYKKAMNEIESEQWKTVGKAVENGYSVSSQQALKIPSSKKGEIYVNNMITGILGSIPLIAYMSYKSSKYTGYEAPYNGTTVQQSPYLIVGNKFTVKKKK